METQKDGHRVRDTAPIVSSSCLIRPPSRSQSSAGHKTQWHARIEKTKSENAVKKLETELKQEKQAEKQR